MKLASTIPNRWSSESHVSLLRHGRVATEVGEANVSRLDRRSAAIKQGEKETTKAEGLASDSENEVAIKRIERI